MVPPKNCLPSEQSIFVHAFHFVEHLRSHQSASNTILHNKLLLHLHYHGEVYCQHIPIVIPFRGCFACSSITRRQFRRLCCASALSTRKRTSFSMMYCKCPIGGASTTWTCFCRTRVVCRRFPNTSHSNSCNSTLRKRSINAEKNKLSNHVLFFPVGGTTLAYEFSASNFVICFVLSNDILLCLSWRLLSTGVLYSQLPGLSLAKKNISHSILNSPDMFDLIFVNHHPYLLFEKLSSKFKKFSLMVKVRIFLSSL